MESSSDQLSGTSSSYRGATSYRDTVRVPRGQETHHVMTPPDQASSTSSPSTSFTGPAAEAGSPSLMLMPSEHHLNPSSHTRDSTDVRRSGSHSNRRRSPSRSLSELPNQRPSPSYDLVPMSEPSNFSTTPRIGAAQNQAPSLINHRLQDILQDTPVATSSSLPNMAYFPSSLTRESRRSREKEKDKLRGPSRSPSPSKLPSPYSKQERETLPAAETYESAPVRTKPVVPDLSNAPISTASMAAQAAEKAKQERRRAEQAEAERERHKGEKVERERADHDRRRRAESERVRPAVSGASPLLGSTGSMVHTSSSYQQPYSSSPSLNYAPQRTPTSTLGRSSFKAERYGPRAIPIPIPARG